MGVSIEVDLDLNIEDDISTIKNEIRSLESIDLSDIDLGSLEDLDVTVDDDDKLSSFVEDIDNIPNTVEVETIHRGGVGIPRKKTVYVDVVVDESELEDLGSLEDLDVTIDDDKLSSFVEDINNIPNTVEVETIHRGGVDIPRNKTVYVDVVVDESELENLKDTVDLDVTVDDDNKLSSFVEDINNIPNTVEVETIHRGGVDIPRNKTVYVDVVVDENELEDLKDTVDLDVTVDDDKLSSFVEDIDNIPNTVEVETIHRGGVDIPRNKTVYVDVVVDESELEYLKDTVDVNLGDVSSGSSNSELWLEDIHSRLDEIQMLLSEGGGVGGETTLNVSAPTEIAGDADDMDSDSGINVGEVDFPMEGTTIDTSSNVEANLREMAGLREGKSFADNLDMGGYAGLSPRNVGGGGGLNDIFKNKKLSEMREQMDKAREASSALIGSLDSLRPTFAGLYAIVAALLPALIGAYTQIIGLATALGALGAAGGAIALLGALGGQAETLKGSMKGLEQSIKDTKREIFQVFEPIADRFAPILGRFKRRAVQSMSELRDEIAQLSRFKGVFFSLLGPFTDALERTVQYALELAPAIKDAARRIGMFVASHLPEFLRNLTKEGLRSLDTLAQLGAVVFQVARLVYGLSKTILNIAAIFSFLAGPISFVADLLSSDMVQGLAMVISFVGYTVGVVWALTTALEYLMFALGSTGTLMSWLSGTAIVQFLSSIASSIIAVYEYIAALSGLNAALATTAALIGIITGGLAIIAGLGALASQWENIMSPDINQSIGSGGSFSGSGVGSSSGGDVTINVHGQPEQPTIDKMKDVANQVSEKEDARNGNW